MKKGIIDMIYNMLKLYFGTDSIHCSRSSESLYIIQYSIFLDSSTDLCSLNFSFKLYFLGFVLILYPQQGHDNQSHLWIHHNFYNVYYQKSNDPKIYDEYIFLCNAFSHDFNVIVVSILTWIINFRFVKPDS